jgi:hypothetical protein
MRQPLGEPAEISARVGSGTLAIKLRTAPGLAVGAGLARGRPGTATGTRTGLHARSATATATSSTTGSLTTHIVTTTAVTPRLHPPSPTPAPTRPPSSRLRLPLSVAPLSLSSSSSSLSHPPAHTLLHGRTPLRRSEPLGAPLHSRAEKSGGLCASLGQPASPASLRPSASRHSLSSDSHPLSLAHPHLLTSPPGSSSLLRPLSLDWSCVGCGSARSPSA